MDNPNERKMILLGEITLNFDAFENKKTVEESFPFRFRDALYGENWPKGTTKEEYEYAGSQQLVNRAFSSLIGQIIRLPNGERVIIQEVYVNYWQQICAHGELVLGEGHVDVGTMDVEETETTKAAPSQG